MKGKTTMPTPIHDLALPEIDVFGLDRASLIASLELSLIHI